MTLQSAYRLAPRSGSLNRLALTMIAGFAVLAAGAVFGRVDIVATAPGRVVSAYATRPIAAQTDAILMELLVKDGDQVSEGAPLLQLDDAQFRLERDWKEQWLSELQLQRLAVQTLLTGAENDPFKEASSDDVLRRKWRSYMETLRLETKAKLSIFDREAAEVSAELRRVETEARRAKERVDLLGDRRSAIAALVKRGVTPRFEEIETELEFVQALSEAERLDARKSELDASSEHIAAQRKGYLTGRQAAFYQELHRADEAIARTQGEIGVLEARIKRHLVRAPISGIVQETRRSALSQWVETDEPLMKIVPSGAGVEIVARIRNRDISFVEPGQSAIVRLEAFSVSRYSGLEAIVERISLDTAADRDQRISTSSLLTDARRLSRDRTENSADTSYIAHLRIIDPEKSSMRLQPGLSTLVNISTGERRIVDFLLEPILRGWNTALRER